MIPLDYHIHTRFSPDSTAVPEEMCRRAIELGLPDIGFSEHWDVGPYERVTRFLQPEAWWEELLRLRSLFAGQLILRAGIEIAEPHLYPKDTRAILSRLPFDYALGSVHFVGSHEMFDDKYIRQCTADEVYLPYFAELEKMVRVAGVDIVAHFDIPSRTAIPLVGYDVERYEEPIRAVLAIVIERGLALDVNVSGLRKPSHNLMPAPEILAWYRQMGGERLTLGSDAHSVDQLGTPLEEALRHIQSAGFTHLTQYNLRRPQQIPLSGMLSTPPIP
jgi:histidinol-phosphatase (PHP family)